ncbi:MAG: alpha-glucan family phosphorylase [Actinomycetota bacterium]|nr:alpha-glucan family phosphorylase [Actinomycetota bacterium]
MTPHEASAVLARLPQNLDPLGALAYNLRSTWDSRARALFEAIDPETWQGVAHNPVALLRKVDRDRLTELAEDEIFLGRLREAAADLEDYGRTPNDRLPRPIAYFSPEFGIASFLPTYSGGLGVLAGDHLKAASDLCVPLVGVGLLYRRGYFKQSLDATGYQKEDYPEVDTDLLPLELLRDDDGAPLEVLIDLAGAPCRLRIWRAPVGRVDLLLLDSDVEANEDGVRRVADRLYSGDIEHRLRQEIVLGVGGARALKAAGYEPGVWHSNEGHAGFLGLERIRQLVGIGVDFDEAMNSVRPRTIFTTHTPLPVAIDVFPSDLMERYFTGFAADCGVDFERVMSLGIAPGTDDGGFNMAVLGIRLSERVTGVSKLHGDISKGLFKFLWPDLPPEKIPITSVTNGVHTPTWVGPEVGSLAEDRADHVSDPNHWVDDIDDSKLWEVRTQARARLVRLIRRRLESGSGAAHEVFDDQILTIGFARRFAQYKRATLMLTDPERLRAMLLSTERPVQIVVAGKAHPLDEGGKEMIRSLVEFSSDPEVSSRFVFLEDYDMDLGRVLTQGVDVWLNNPRRPLEACGTSGMKAALNGVLNCSVLDGWWDELFDGENGWRIGGRDVAEDPALQDLRDAAAEYEVLEREVIPLFYDRDEAGLPRGWIRKMRKSIRTLWFQVSAERMMEDYLARLYRPAANEVGENARSDRGGVR